MCFSGVVVGQILSVSPHVNAERLSVCLVNVGQNLPLQIVCGADNVREGLIVPVALIGAKLPGNWHIKKAKLRGVESFGMICSSKDLGLDEIDPRDGVMELPDRYTVGSEFIFSGCGVAW